MLDKLAQHFQSNFYPDMAVEDVRAHLDNPEVLNNGMAHIAETGHDDPEIHNAAVIHSEINPLPATPIQKLTPIIPPPQRAGENLIQPLQYNDIKGYTTEGAKYAAYENYKRGLLEIGDDDISKIQYLNNRFKDGSFPTLQEAQKDAANNLEKMKNLEHYYTPNGDNEYFVPSNKTIKLTQGRYNLGKIDTALIDNIVKQSKAKGVNPLDVLAVAGRESTFANEYLNGKEHEQSRNPNDYSQIFSQWQQKQPTKNLLEFLYEKGVKGINKKVVKQGYQYDFNYNSDPETQNSHDVAKDSVTKSITPKMMAEYESILKNKLKTTPINSLERTIDIIKNNKLASYNPGDKDYPNKIAKEKALLLQEKALVEYIKKKHGIDLK